MDVSLDDARYDNRPQFNVSADSSNRKLNRRQKRAAAASGGGNGSARKSSSMNEDFIPLSGGGGHGGPSNSRKKGASYDFAHTLHGNSTTMSKKAKKKGKPLLQGHRTDGTTPNNQLYESGRSKKRKTAKRKANRKPQTNRKSSH